MNKSSGFHPVVIMQPKWKKLHIANRICLPPLLPSNSSSFFIQTISPQVSEICLLTRDVGAPDVWRFSHFWVLIAELSVTKNSLIYFEGGNNVISLPACITPGCPKQFCSNFLPTHFWAETKQGKFGPQRTVVQRSWEQVEAKLSDETHLTIVICPLCLSGAHSSGLLGTPCFPLLSIMLAFPAPFPSSACPLGWSKRFKPVNCINFLQNQLETQFKLDGGPAMTSQPCAPRCWGRSGRHRMAGLGSSSARGLEILAWIGLETVPRERAGLGRRPVWTFRVGVSSQASRWKSRQAPRKRQSRGSLKSYSQGCKKRKLPFS